MYLAERLPVANRALAATVAAMAGVCAISGCSMLKQEEPVATTQCFESELGVPSSSGEPSRDFHQAILNSIYQVERQNYSRTHPNGPKFGGPMWSIYTNATDASRDIGKQMRAQATNSTVKEGAPFWYCIDSYKNDAGKVNKKVIRAATLDDIQRDKPALDK